MHRLRRVQLILTCVFILSFLAAGCHSSDGLQEEQQVQVFRVDTDAGVLVAASEAVPAEEEPLEFALRESDPGILLSHVTSEEGTTLHVDAGWQPGSGQEETLSVYALVNAAAPLVEEGSVRVARGEDTSDMLCDGAHLVADLSLMREGWHEEWVSPVDGVSVWALDAVPSDFSPVGWTDEHTVLGVAGGRLALHHVDAGTTEWVELDVWTALPSSDGETFAFTDAEGIKLVSLCDPDSAEMISGAVDTGGDEGEWRLVSFSPEGTQLLFARVYEWDAAYFVHDLQSGDLSRLNTDLQGYFLTHGGTWVGSDSIVFNVRAVARKNGKAEYGFGMRGDLALYCLSEDCFKLITDVEDGRFVTAEGRTAGGEIVYRDYSPARRPIAGTYRPNSTEMTAFCAPAAAVYPDTSGEQFAVTSDLIRMVHGSHLHMWIYEGAAPTGELRVRDVDGPVQVHWAPAGDQIIISAAFRRGAQEDAGMEETRRTFLVSPHE